jgi:hypothetical protein
VILSSPYRFVVQPVVDHVLEVERQNKDRMIAVVIPQLVEPHWYNYSLHNQRGQLLAALMMLKGDRRIVTIGVPCICTNKAGRLRSVKCQTSNGPCQTSNSLVKRPDDPPLCAAEERDLF